MMTTSRETQMPTIVEDILGLAPDDAVNTFTVDRRCKSVTATVAALNPWEVADDLVRKLAPGAEPRQVPTTLPPEAANKCWQGSGGDGWIATVWTYFTPGPLIRHLVDRVGWRLRDYDVVAGTFLMTEDPMAAAAAGDITVKVVAVKIQSDGAVQMTTDALVAGPTFHLVDGVTGFEETLVGLMGDDYGVCTRCEKVRKATYLGATEVRCAECGAEDLHG